MNMKRRLLGRTIVPALILSGAFFAAPVFAATMVCDNAGSEVECDWSIDSGELALLNPSGPFVYAPTDDGFQIEAVDATPLSGTLTSSGFTTFCEENPSITTLTFYLRDGFSGGSPFDPEPSDTVNCPEPPPECGNSVVEGSEQCDDGNLTDGDGCSAMCEIETEVGPLVDPEQYDDILISGWQLSGDLIRGVWAVALVIALALALLEYFTRRATQYVRDDKRE